MPGIDKSRFITDIDDEMICQICLAVLMNPMETQCCRQTYCNDCIKPWIIAQKTCPNDRKLLTIKRLIQPSRLLVNLLDKQKLKCDFFENGCLEDITYVRYKHHVKDCRYNPEAICCDCGEKNGQRSDHNCVQLLIAKYKCLQNLQTNFNGLECSNKQLTDKIANLEKELINIKIISDTNRIQPYDKNLNEKNSQLNALNKNLSAKCERLEYLTKNADKTIRLLNEELRTIKDTLKDYNNLKIINKQIIDNFNQINNVISNVNIEFDKNLDELKNKNNQCLKLLEITRRFELSNKQLSENLKRNNLEMDKYRPLIEENKRLKESIQLFEKNWSLIKQTNTEKISVLLKVNINNIRHQRIDGNPVYYPNRYNLSWNISTKLIIDNNIEYLSFHLVCSDYSKSALWSCIASIEMSIEPQCKAVMSRNVHELSCICSADHNICGYDKYIPWHTMIDNNYGYVKDDTILLNASILIW